MAEVQDMNYFKRLIDIRRRRIEKRAGKELIIPEEEMLDAIRRNKIPTMIQHCILKVNKKVGGNDKEKFLSACNICAATFAKHGYLKARGSLQMTGKGIKRNRQHQREKEAGSKKGKYQGLVTRVWRAQMGRMDKEEAKGLKKEKGEIQKSISDLTRQQRELSAQYKVLQRRYDAIVARRKRDRASRRK